MLLPSRGARLHQPRTLLSCLEQIIFVLRADGRKKPMFTSIKLAIPSVDGAM